MIQGAVALTADMDKKYSWLVLMLQPLILG